LAITGLTTLTGLLAPVLAFLSPLNPNQLGSPEFQTADGTPISPADITEGIGKVGSLFGKPTLIVRKNGQLFGYEAVCSHLGCIIRWNDSLSAIECPCHGGVFDLEGTVVAGPPPDGLERVSVRVDVDRIYKA
jgi:Rieske Fe-S protein